MPSPASKVMYQLCHANGEMTTSDLSRWTNIPSKDITHTCHNLQKTGLIKSELKELDIKVTNYARPTGYFPMMGQYSYETYPGKRKLRVWSATDRAMEILKSYEYNLDWYRWDVAKNVILKKLEFDLALPPNATYIHDPRYNFGDKNPPQKEEWKVREKVNRAYYETHSVSEITGYVDGQKVRGQELPTKSE